MSTETDPRITPSLHPDNITQIDGYDDVTAGVLAPTLTAFSEAYERLRTVHNAREKARTNPTWNDAMQVIQTQDLADKVMARVSRTFDATRANLTKGISFLEQELSQPLESRASASIAAEIRAHVKSLPTEKRHEFIRQATANGDATTVSAVLGAPPYLSGLNDEFQKIYTRHWHEKASPEAAKRLKAMKGARTMIEERAGLMFSGLEKAVGCPYSTAKKLREARTAAEQAFILRDV